MNARLILLLTLDPTVEDAITKAPLQPTESVCIARTVSDALRIVSGNGGELELVVIDFDHGPHGMTLISAIKTCRNRLPILALTPPGDDHAKILARAAGATQCVAKPVSGEQMAKAMLDCRPK
jgi:DNA-binding response OmpR family regulator